MRSAEFFAPCVRIRTGDGNGRLGTPDEWYSRCNIQGLDTCVLFSFLAGARTPTVELHAGGYRRTRGVLEAAGVGYRLAEGELHLLRILSMVYEFLFTEHHRVTTNDPPASDIKGDIKNSIRGIATVEHYDISIIGVCGV